MKRTNALVFLLCMFSLISCRQTSVPVREEFLIPAVSPYHMQDTVIYDSLNHLSFSRLRHASDMGMYWHFEMPEEMQGKDYDLVFEGRVRSNYVQSKGVLVFTAYDMHKAQVCWWTLPLSPHIEKLNEWNAFRDSLRLTGWINGAHYSTIRVFPFLGDSKQEHLDFDTLKITLKQRQEL
ncbi:MAG TPA: hypothetical protein PLQ93_09220 [Bacteroidia bacterium]|nr:hypothetical protein [Bacteroidia bacterium]